LGTLSFAKAFLCLRFKQGGGRLSNTHSKAALYRHGFDGLTVGLGATGYAAVCR
jgi:hypothetical protein